MQINFNSYKFQTPHFKAKKQQDPKRKTGLTDEEGKNLFSYNGKIVNKDNELFSGFADGLNDNGETIGMLYYENGIIKDAYDFVHGEEKKYSYNNPLSLQADSKIVFPDNSALYRQNYYFYPPCATKITTKSGKVSERYYNPNPKYNGEPSFISHSPNSHYEILSKTGTDRIVPFATTKEAKEYFKKEFGISVDYFSSMQEAILWHDAVMEYQNIDYKNQKGKLFFGLDIVHENMKNDDDSVDSATIACVVLSKYYMTNELRQKYEKGTLTVQEIEEKYSENDVSKGKIKIAINSNYDIENALEARLSTDFEKNYHPYYLAKMIYAHELAHYIHMKNISAKEQLIVELSYVPRYIADVVGGYAGEKPLEFVAEYITGRLSGKTYPDYVNDEYLKLYGPILFNDLQRY